MHTSSGHRMQIASIGKPSALTLCGSILMVAICLAMPASASAQALLTQGPSPSDSEILPDAPQPQLPASQLPAPQHTTAPEAHGHISGVVSDIQGGLIPGAHVIAEHVDAAPPESQQATADGNGFFRFSDLIAGSYIVTISSPGFETYRIPDIHLKPGEAYELPEVALPIARTTADATVTLTEQQIAEVELNDELHQRVLGILPNYYTSYIWDAAPLTMRQKFKLAIRSATDPVFFGTTGISTGIQYATAANPEYGTGPSGYFELYASNYGGALVGRVVTSVLLNSLFKEDPRYFVMTNGSVVRRSWHAISSTFLQRGDDKHWHPAYSNFIGGGISAVVVSTWHPDSSISMGSRVLNDTVLDLGGEAIRNLAREFLFRHLARHVPTYAKGKPPEE